MRAIHELEDLYRQRAPGAARRRPSTGELGEVPWLLEELRISHFAQAVGPHGQVSAKKIRRILDEAAR